MLLDPVKPALRELCLKLGINLLGMACFLVVPSADLMGYLNSLCCSRDGSGTA